MPGSFSSQLIEFFKNDNSAAILGNLIIFRILFSASLLLKHVIELSRQYPTHAKPGSFIYETYINQIRIKYFWAHVYFFSFHLRPFFIIFLFWGLKAQIFAFLLMISYVGELNVLFRYHVMTACIFLSILTFDPAFSLLNAGEFIHAKTIGNIFAATINAPGVLFIKSLVVVMYGASAWRKIQNRFYDGVVLDEGMKFSLQPSGRKFKDHPNELTKILLVNLVAGKSKKLSMFLIAAEISVCVLLFLPSQYALVGCIVGLIMHVGMTLLFPITLSFFTLMMMASYALWIKIF